LSAFSSFPFFRISSSKKFPLAKNIVDAVFTKWLSIGKIRIAAHNAAALSAEASTCNLPNSISDYFTFAAIAILCKAGHI
jgi:hypothetical protein